MNVSGREEEEMGGGGQRRRHLLLHIGRYVGRHFIRGCVTKYTVLVRRKAQNDDHNETGKEQNDSSAEEASCRSLIERRFRGNMKERWACPGLARCLAVFTLIVITSAMRSGAASVLLPHNLGASGEEEARIVAVNRNPVRLLPLARTARRQGSGSGSGGSTRPTPVVPILPTPIIKIRPDLMAGHVVRSAIGITVEITAPANLNATLAKNSQIFYTASNESDFPECNSHDETGAVGAHGRKYENSFHYCGETSPVKIRAILCPRATATGDVVRESEVAERRLDVRRYEPPAPLAPVVEPDAWSSCAQQGLAGVLVCSVGVQAADFFPSSTEFASQDTALLKVVTRDYVCSNPMYGTQEECISNSTSNAWRPMKQCPEGREKDDSKPCLQIYYTLDGSDPLSALPGATRELYQAAKGLSLGTGTWSLKVAAVRMQRKYNAVTCKCCCKDAECLLPGVTAALSVSVRARANSPRDELVGSPDIHMLLDQPFIEFAKHFYGQKRLQWRTAVAEALGLLQQQELGDYRRIRGDCSCSEASGCLLLPDEGADICFRGAPGSPSSRTLVTFYITAAGLCVGGLNRGICISNSSCGSAPADGYCELKRASWLLGYSRLQSGDEATREKLSRIGVLNVSLSLTVDVSSIGGDAAGAAAEALALEAVAGLLALLLLLVCCYAARGSAACASCMPAATSAAQSARKQVVAKIKTTRGEAARLGRHAQFQRMVDHPENCNDSHVDSERDASSEAEVVDSGAPWQRQSRRGGGGSVELKTVQSVSMPPLHSFISTSQVLAQPMQQLGRGAEAEEVEVRSAWDRDMALDREADWLQPANKASVRERIGVSGGQILVEMLYDPQQVAWGASQLELVLFFINNGEADVSELTCKAAVPKYMQVQITPPSRSTLCSGASMAASAAAQADVTQATQTVRLAGITKLKPVKLRLKVEYTRGGARMEETFDVNLSKERLTSSDAKMFSLSKEPPNLAAV